MMLLNYFVWGAWYVTIGTFMGEALGFSDLQIGSVYATNAIAAMVSPFFVGMIADRFFNAERILGILHLLGAIVMFMATQSTDFGSFYFFILLYNLCFMPSIAITNSIAFNQMDNPEKSFPYIRVWGTLGWIAIGVIIGSLSADATVLPLQIAAGASVLMGLYSFLLPPTPPKAKGQKVSAREILGLDALALMKRPAFAILIISSVLVCIPLAFYYNFTNLFLNEIGMENAAARMTLGQVSEVLFLLIMPLLFVRLGVKKMIMVGVLAWALRYVLFAFGDIEGNLWMLYAGIILHGICYDFFFVTGQIFVDNEAPEELKSSAQGLITFATYGLGLFTGSYVSGAVIEHYANLDAANNVIGHDWTGGWLVPAALAGAVLLFFAFAFREKKETAV